MNLDPEAYLDLDPKPYWGKSRIRILTGVRIRHTAFDTVENSVVD